MNLLRKSSGKTGDELKAEQKYSAESSLPNQAELKKIIFIRLVG